MNDFLIKNALIVDGMGGPAFIGNLAIKESLITDISQTESNAKNTIDAEGLAIAPGIIDGHTHYDAQITWDPFATPSTAHGVTTAVIGNCGFTIAPCRPNQRELIMSNLTHVEGMSLEALRSGICWEFETFSEYLNMLERKGVGLNIAAYFGHSSLRTYVLGAEASQRASTKKEINQMAKLMCDAMESGALGFASSTNEPHNGERGLPMPSRLANSAEFSSILKAMRQSGRGLYMLTKGMKTSIAELESLSAETSAPVLIAAMFHSELMPNAVFEELNKMEEARQRGHQLIPQTSCCPLVMDFTLENPYLFEGLAAWNPAMKSKDQSDLKSIYADPDFIEKVEAELDSTNSGLFNGEWERVNLVEALLSEHKQYEGYSLKKRAKELGTTPLRLMLEISLKEDLKTLFSAKLLNTDESGVTQLLKRQEAHIALSDAGAHLNFLCDAGFGLHLLGHWVRDKKVLSLEHAVKRLTAQPAALFGFRNRGILSSGKIADLLLFDPNKVGRGKKIRVNDLPTGASRLITEPAGVHGVWVNGKQIVDKKGLMDDAPLAGKVMRSFEDSRLITS